jgi:hypothetical protein
MTIAPADAIYLNTGGLLGLLLLIILILIVLRLLRII